MATKTRQQVLSSNLQEARRHWQREANVPAAKPSIKWTVTISRMEGARGSAIASNLREQLDWPLYNRQLLEKIAEEAHLRTELLDSVDEQHVSWIIECLEAFSGEIPISEKYIKYLPKVIASLGAKGESIIVGRGANFLLPLESTLRVRLVAPRADRVAHFAREAGISEREAGKQVDSIERHRAEFIKDHFHCNAETPELYDVVINTSRFSDDQCSRLIQNALDAVRGY